MNFPFFHRPRESQAIAVLRDGYIEMGTRLLLLEDIVQNKRQQQRDALGRFVSPSVGIRKQLEELAASLDPEARAAARTRASIGGGRGR